MNEIETLIGNLIAATRDDERASPWSIAKQSTIADLIEERQALLTKFSALEADLAAERNEIDSLRRQMLNDFTRIEQIKRIAALEAQLAGAQRVIWQIYSSYNSWPVDWRKYAGKDPESEEA